jgi:four helix bundle suffix protein
LRAQTKWEDLYFYRKAEVLYQLTVAFCRRFLPRHGDRTVDQMVQAARSGKQNIVEGLADGVTSTEMELRLLNVARASLRELREDYGDFLKARGLPVWGAGHPRYDGVLEFCRARNDLVDYAPFFETLGAEELGNLALTLCHMTDRLMVAFLEKRAADFAENGGIKDRMTAVRLGRRRSQAEEIAALRAENAALKAEITALRAEAARGRGGDGVGGKQER